VLTMLLGGLWPGASWTFVAWGGLHGVALALTRLIRGERAPAGQSGWRALLGVVLTFHFVTATWILFRADSFGLAWTYFGRLFTLTAYHPNLEPTVLAVLGVGLVSHFVPERWYATLRDRFTLLPAPAQGVALFAAALVVRELASADAVPFVYFQF
jgi:alginate O-acetyltransferase complex protein AlgI